MYQGNDCTTPSRFKEEVGYLKVRSALANSNYCRFGETPGSTLDDGTVNQLVLIYSIHTK